MRITRLVKAMNQKLASHIIAAQIIRSGTSVSTNDRTACIENPQKNFTNQKTEELTQLFLSSIRPAPDNS